LSEHEALLAARGLRMKVCQRQTSRLLVYLLCLLPACGRRVQDRAMLRFCELLSDPDTVVQVDYGSVNVAKELGLQQRRKLTAVLRSDFKEAPAVAAAPRICVRVLREGSEEADMRFNAANHVEIDIKDESPDASYFVSREVGAYVLQWGGDLPPYVRAELEAIIEDRDCGVTSPD
jgi:hypothetical protein